MSDDQVGLFVNPAQSYQDCDVESGLFVVLLGSCVGREATDIRGDRSLGTDPAG